jgi:hypothetical protein
MSPVRSATAVLLQFQEELRTRFRCRTGHPYSAATRLAVIEEGIEDSVWNAIPRARSALQ